MLFSSHEFVFVFLPLVLALYFLVRRVGAGRYVFLYLVLASFVFYGYYRPAYVLLLIASIGGNYLLGRALRRRGDRRLLALGIAANLGLLAYFKYFNFFAEQINAVTGANIDFISVSLPLGISFFTFQQIAYLVDSHRGEVPDESLLRYALFISFFPQLIAGPIVHHAEMMPQFRASRRDVARDLILGLTIFFIGLFKKTVIADGLDGYTRPFDVAAAGQTITLVEAWAGTIAYTFQIYFDFSAYSDMAIGIARMFGIVLPANFLSPYKAVSAADFWKRWHVTLSRFLRDYVYVPLGGNRRGEGRRLVNLMLTMGLGGLWHGAGWNFVLWGTLHGLYLVVYRLWRGLMGPRDIALPRPLAIVITFLAVLAAWVPFRAADLATTLEVYRAMAGLNGFVLPSAYAGLLAPVQGILDMFGLEYVDREILFDGVEQAALYMGLLGFVWLMPNVVDIFAREKVALLEGYRPLDVRWSWRAGMRWAAATGMIAAFALAGIDRLVAFIYFQF